MTFMRLDDGRVATENLVPGVRVYDEDLVRMQGREWRSWNPTRSKLAAYILKGGGTDLKLDERTRVLYLGAANGTTPSHVSDIVRDGLVWSVEFSPRSFRDLAQVSERRENLVPFLADAWRPELYAKFVQGCDLLYQDIAQRQQAAIFAKNLNRFRPAQGLLMIKSRSVDVAREPRDVYEEVVREVETSSPYRIVEVIDIGPYEKDHAAALFERTDAPRERPAERERERPERREAPRPPERRATWGKPGSGAPRGPPRENRGPPRQDRRDSRGDRRDSSRPPHKQPGRHPYQDRRGRR